MIPLGLVFFRTRLKVLPFPLSWWGRAGGWLTVTMQDGERRAFRKVWSLSISHIGGKCCLKLPPENKSSDWRGHVWPTYAQKFLQWDTSLVRTVPLKFKRSFFSHVVVLKWVTQRDKDIRIETIVSKLDSAYYSAALTSAVQLSGVKEKRSIGHRTMPDFSEGRRGLPRVAEGRRRERISRLIRNVSWKRTASLIHS